MACTPIAAIWCWSRARSPTPRAAAITQASIELGHRLGFEVLAEGVENREQYDFLRQWDCDLAQGHYLSRPLPAPEAVAFVAGHR